MLQLSLHAPLFDLTLTEENGALVAVDWGWGFGEDRTPLLLDVKKQLDDYFDGEAITIKTKLDQFELEEDKEFWDEITAIPYGQTISYKELSERSDMPLLEVKERLMANPFPIIIPCHRVTPQPIPPLAKSEDVSDIILGDYVGDEGVDAKRALLILEGILKI